MSAEHRTAPAMEPTLKGTIGGNKYQLPLPVLLSFSMVDNEVQVEIKFFARVLTCSHKEEPCEANPPEIKPPIML
jgi:hypothetical protein